MSVSEIEMLTARMRGEFQGSFAELRDDLNKVGETLTNTVTALRSASRWRSSLQFRGLG